MPHWISWTLAYVLLFSSLLTDSRIQIKWRLDLALVSFVETTLLMLSLVQESPDIGNMTVLVPFPLTCVCVMALAKLCQFLKSSFVDCPLKAAVILVAYAPFPARIFPFSQLSIIRFNTLKPASFFSNDLLCLTLLVEGTRFKVQSQSHNKTFPKISLVCGVGWVALCMKQKLFFFNVFLWHRCGVLVSCHRSRKNPLLHLSCVWFSSLRCILWLLILSCISVINYSLTAHPI